MGTQTVIYTGEFVIEGYGGIGGDGPAPAINREWPMPGPGPVGGSDWIAGGWG
ncbi:MAG: hypothetical protein V3W20_11700 [Candidatus Neomarinimicrobiota bacterium]